MFTTLTCLISQAVQNLNDPEPHLTSTFYFICGLFKFFSYFIPYFNDTIDRLAFIKQKVLPATVNEEISIATLLNDAYLPCSYIKRFSAQNTSVSCRPSRIVSFW